MLPVIFFEEEKKEKKKEMEREKSYLYKMVAEKAGWLSHCLWATWAVIVLFWEVFRTRGIWNLPIRALRSLQATTQCSIKTSLSNEIQIAHTMCFHIAPAETPSYSTLDRYLIQKQSRLILWFTSGHNILRKAFPCSSSDWLPVNSNIYSCKGFLKLIILHSVW